MGQQPKAIFKKCFTDPVLVKKTKYKKYIFIISIYLLMVVNVNTDIQMNI